MDRQMYRLMDGSMDTSMDRWTEEQTNGQRDRQTDRQRSRRTLTVTNQAFTITTRFHSDKQKRVGSCLAEHDPTLFC